MTTERLAEIEARLATWETAPADRGLRDAWAEFRAHAPQDLRDLLAEVRSLRAALARANDPTWPCGPGTHGDAEFDRDTTPWKEDEPR